MGEGRKTYAWGERSVRPKSSFSFHDRRETFWAAEWEAASLPTTANNYVQRNEAEIEIILGGVALLIILKMIHGR